MPNSPSHQLGELIGDFFESSIIYYLLPIVTKKGYYLDYRHPRSARDNKREVIGVDNEGNKHKLDIVIEEGGSETRVGKYKAFIEMAWRRYTKHSKNKVQEIAGAILPLVQKNAREIPFYAAVLAGGFTDSSIKQLESQGFYVLYFTYEDICRVFDSVNLSIRWEENTSRSKIQGIENSLNIILSDKNKLIKLQRTFCQMYSEQLNELAEALSDYLDTSIQEVLVTPIHGQLRILDTIKDAIDFVMSYDEHSSSPILRYEILIRYSNEEEYKMICNDKRKAIQFLNQYN